MIDFAIGIVDGTHRRVPARDDRTRREALGHIGFQRFDIGDEAGDGGLLVTVTQQVVEDIAETDQQQTEDGAVDHDTGAG